MDKKMKNINSEPIAKEPIICKLIILFTLENMEFPLTEQTIIDICYSKNNWISYMDCKEYLYKLVESNLIYKTESKNREEMFDITYDGRNCLGHFYDKMDNSLREQITEYTKANRVHFKRTQEYVYTCNKSEDGSHVLDLIIRSDNLSGEPLFEIKIKAPTRQSAYEACKKWQAEAHSVYETVYEMLIQE